MIIWIEPSYVETVLVSPENYATLTNGWCEKALDGASRPSSERIRAAELLCEDWGCEAAVIYPVVPEACGLSVTLQQLVTWFGTDHMPEADTKQRVWQWLGNSSYLKQSLTEKPAWRLACWGMQSWGKELSYPEQVKRAAASQARALSVTEALWLHLIVDEQPGDWALNTADIDKNGPLVICIHQSSDIHFAYCLEYNLCPDEAWPWFSLAVGFD